MEPNGRDDGGGKPRMEHGSLVHVEMVRDERHQPETDVVFDFSGLRSPDLTDLGLILTARLGAGPRSRVWVRSLPYRTWKILRALGLDHLFHIYPAPGDDLN